MSKNDKKGTIISVIFYFLFTVSLLIQAYLIELKGDEAYYWRYSKELAWGYFDHPPMVAFLIKLGYALLENELGVRLFFVLLIVATIWLAERIIQPTNKKLFYAIVASVAFLQIGMSFGGGMFAIPDFPLLFFSVLTIYIYQKYLLEDSWQWILAMAITLALLMLSKYHGILVIGFMILSKPDLLRRKSFWIVGIVALALFLPHLWWQYVNDFPSFKFHLSQRSTKPYSVSYTLEYLATQPFVLGPLISVILIVALFKAVPENEFERYLKFLAMGTYLFFLIMTFKGRVEANWTVITLLPLLWFGYRFIESRIKLISWTYTIFFISIILILFVRIILAVEWLPAGLDKVIKFHKTRSWVKRVKEKAGQKPVAFMSSYQRPSAYEFYSGNESFSLNNVWGRDNQYSLWDTEFKFQSQPVFLVYDWNTNLYDSMLVGYEYFSYRVIDNFLSTANINVKLDDNLMFECGPSDTLKVELKFIFTNNNLRNLDEVGDSRSYLFYSFLKDGFVAEMKDTKLMLTNDMLKSGSLQSIDIVTPDQPGKYTIIFSVATGTLPQGINSRPYQLIIK